MRIALGLTVLVAAGAIRGGAQPPQPAPSSPSELVARVVAAQHTRGYSLRARLITAGRGLDRPAVVQIRVLARRDAEGSRIVYQALWPGAVKGQAACFHVRPGQPVSGFSFSLPDVATPLTRDTLTSPLFGTELTVEDLVEDFWDWPGPSGGMANAGSVQPCRLVELRPPVGADSPYVAVRSCISAEKALPLLVEKVDRLGRVVRRFRVEKTVRRNGRWMPARMVVESPGSGRTTTMEVSRGTGDLAVDVAEFSPARLQRLGAVEGTAPRR